MRHRRHCRWSVQGRVFALQRDLQKDIADGITVGNLSAEYPWSVAQNFEGDVSTDGRRDDFSTKLFGPRFDWMFIGLVMFSKVPRQRFATRTSKLLMRT